MVGLVEPGRVQKGARLGGELAAGEQQEVEPAVELLLAQEQGVGRASSLLQPFPLPGVR